MRTIPWITKDAIIFLNSLDLSNYNILEFGMGGSTIYFASRCKHLISIEHDSNWYKNVNKYLVDNTMDKNVQSYLKQRPYNTICETLTNIKFDLIFIDGRDRVECAKSSIKLLSDHGIIMLDNAERERYSEIYDLLKDFKFFKTVQLEPDEYDGSFSVNWQTNWWTK